MIDLKPACQHLSKLVAGIGEEQLDNSTPCPEYAVRDLIEHLDESARGFAAAAGADADTTPLVAGSLPHGWRELLGSRLKTLGEAWDDPAAWQGRTDFGGGLDFSNEEWGKIALTEVVVHGWDLSKATGSALRTARDDGPGLLRPRLRIPCRTAGSRAVGRARRGARGCAADGSPGGDRRAAAVVRKCLEERVGFGHG